MLTPSVHWVYVAAVLQLTQIPAMILLRRKLQLSKALERMEGLPRAYIAAMNTGIVWYVSGMAIVLLLEPDELLRSRLGIALCALHAFAWTTRCLHHWLRVGPNWPTQQGRWLYWITGSIYSCLGVLFAWFLLAA